MRGKRLLIVSASGRISVFLFLFSLFVFLIFILGNFQDFTELSLLNLMLIYRISSLLFVAAGFSYILIMTLASNEGRGKTAGRIITTSVSMTAAAAGYILITILTVALQPVN